MASTAALEKGNGLLGRVWAPIQSHWPVLLVFAAGVVVWQLLNGIKRTRVDDARASRKLGRYCPVSALQRFRWCEPSLCCVLGERRRCAA